MREQYLRLVPAYSSPGCAALGGDSPSLPPIAPQCPPLPPIAPHLPSSPLTALHCPSAMRYHGKNIPHFSSPGLS